VEAGREFDVVMMTEREGGYSVFVPELPNVATQSETIVLPIPSWHRLRSTFP
jgi:hypothetical protein